MSIEHLIWKANPAQSIYELEQLLHACEDAALHPEVVLEIGVHRGGSARVWRAFWNPEMMIGVDDAHDVEAPEEIGIEMVYGRSQDSEVIEAVKSKLDGRYVDFLFIDGGHTYDEVSADFNNYVPFCHGGAVVVFHDAIKETGVRRFIAEHEIGNIRLFHHPLDGGTGTVLFWL